MHIHIVNEFCPRYPLCTLKEDDCRIGNYIELLQELLPNTIESLRKEDFGWNKFRRYK